MLWKQIPTVVKYHQQKLPGIFLVQKHCILAINTLPQPNPHNCSMNIASQETRDLIYVLEDDIAKILVHKGDCTRVLPRQWWVGGARNVQRKMVKRKHLSSLLSVFQNMDFYSGILLSILWDPHMYSHKLHVLHKLHVFTKLHVVHAPPEAKFNSSLAECTVVHSTEQTT